MSAAAGAGGAVSEGGKTPPKSGDQKPEPPVAATYADRLSDIAKWAVGALAAVGGAAVAKLSLDRLGKGELDGALTVWAYVGLVLFAIGVALLVAAVVWHTRAGRVTLGYLLSNAFIAKRIEKYFRENSYLLGGQEDLGKFRERLTTLVKLPRPLTSDARTQLTRLLAARTTILETARAERARHVNGYATALIIVAAVITTLGAATFALATNRDQTLREDRLAKEQREREDVIGGALLPDTPSNVLLVVPSDARPRLATLIGDKCELSGAKATLVEVATPPETARQPVNEPSVFRIVTQRSPECAVRELWVPPSWVIPPPAQGGNQESSTRTSAPSTTTTTRR